MNYMLKRQLIEALVFGVIFGLLFCIFIMRGFRLMLPIFVLSFAASWIKPYGIRLFNRHIKW